MSQLPDAVHKLEDELSKLIKTIDAAMLKEATAEDLASIGRGQGTGATNVVASAGEGIISELDRLQKLPGYDRLQKQLFYNLMAARPDVTDQNVRIKIGRATGTSSAPKSPRSNVAGLLFSQSPSSATAAHVISNVHTNLAYLPGVHEDVVTNLNETRLGEAISDTQAIDRHTIKDISMLVLESEPLAKSGKGALKGKRKQPGSRPAGVPSFKRR